MMVEKVAVNKELAEAARQAGGHRTKQQAVKAALEEYVRLRHQLKIVEIFGAVDYDPSYDHKAARKRRP